MAKKKLSLDARMQNIYNHEAADLKAREELIRRGVKPNTPNMPSMDATNKPGDDVIKRSEEEKARRLYNRSNHK